MNVNIAMTKTVLGYAAKFGAGTIVYSIIRNNVVPANAIQKVTVMVATFALGGAVAGVASNEIEHIVDNIVEGFKSNKIESTSK